MLMTGFCPSCPVCGAGCDKDATACKKRGYADKHKIFTLWTDIEDAQEWFADVVGSYRTGWEIKETKNRQTKLTT